MTSQEREIIINELIGLEDIGDDTFEVKYSQKPQKEFCKNWAVELKLEDMDLITDKLRFSNRNKNSAQMKLF
jgi:hypothetical protein